MKTAAQTIAEVLENGGKVTVVKTTRAFGFFRINDKTTVRVHSSDPVYSNLVIAAS